MQLTNEYGSPSLDDIALVARRLNAEMTLALGEDLAGQIETDVSSPVRVALISDHIRITNTSILFVQVQQHWHALPRQQQVPTRRHMLAWQASCVVQLDRGKSFPQCDTVNRSVMKYQLCRGRSGRSRLHKSSALQSCR